jgi:hypothetical protein
MRRVRKTVIAFVELLQIVSILFWTVCGIELGIRIGKIMGGGMTMPGVPPMHDTSSMEMAGGWIGGFAGFALSATAAAVVFALSQIEANSHSAATSKAGAVAGATGSG